jgi:hypothetical protein
MFRADTMAYLLLILSERILNINQSRPQRSYRVVARVTSEGSKWKLA